LSNFPEIAKPAILEIIYEGFELNRKCAPTEMTDRDAQAHMAIVFLAPTENSCAALAPDSLSLTAPYHPTFKGKSK